ncbi:MAG: SAV_2336 N-terminal domain-related protein [Waterburya sp.]
MRNDRPDRIIAALGTELELTAEDIADVLWLTHIQQQQVEKSPSTFKVYFGDILVNNLGFLIFLLELNFLVSILFCYQFLLSNLAVNKILMKTKSKIEPASQTTTNTTKPPRKIGLVTRKEKPKIINSLEEEIDKPIKVPNAPSIRQPLPLIKALRPLLRSVPSQINPTLDEIATANKIAEERIWQLITQPTLEPWLELALVVDESSSMLIWHRTVGELKKLFNHYGAFRDVRTWSLVVNKQHLGILPRMGIVAKRTMIRSPSELIDPNNRRLILIASDCLSSIWQDKTILPVLENWANNAPVAIVQMFPERMWSRTALGQVSEVELYGLAPGVINKDLLVTTSFLWNDENEKQEQVSVKIPVFSLEPEVASVWSSMVSGRGSISSAGFLFTSELVSTQELVSLVVLLLAKARLTKFALLFVSPSPSANSYSLLEPFTSK